MTLILSLNLTLLFLIVFLIGVAVGQNKEVRE